MTKHSPVINGLVFHLLITERRRLPVLGQLSEKETGEIVFEDEFPSYRDAYWVLKGMDENEYLSEVKVSDTNR
jgi:hypothetical protein